jgi:translocation and assembly module TamB
MAILAVLVLLGVLLVAARLWITSSGGRAFVEAQIDGRKAGPLGVIQIDGLSGDPLDRLGAARITLTDSEGVWLSIDNVDLAWSPARLMSRTVKLDLVSAEKIDVLRRPVMEQNDSQASESSGSWAVSLDQLQIAELLLQEGVAGPRAAFDIDGRFRLPKSRTFDLSLTALPLEGVGDRVDATLKRTASGAYQLNAEIEAPAGGTLSTLAKLPDGDSASLTARASGTLDDGDGFAELKISGATVAEITGKLTAGDLLASVGVNATRLPLSEQLKTLIGPSANLTLDGNIQKARIPFDVSGTLASGTISADGIYRSRARDFDGPINLDVKFSGLDDLANLDANLAFVGTLTHPLEAPSLVGNATLSANSGADLPFRVIDGPLEIVSTGRYVNFKGSLEGTGILASNATAQRIAGKAPKFDVAGDYNRDTGVVALDPSTARLAKGRVTASGTISTREKTLDVQARLQQLSGLLSSAPNLSATGSLAVTGPIASPLIAADLTAKGAGDVNPLAADVFGDSARLRATVQKTDASYLIRSARLDGEKLDLTLSGKYVPDGAASLSGQFKQAAAIDVSGALVDLSSGTFQLSGPRGIENIRLASAGGTFSRSSLHVSDLQTSVNLNRAGDGWAGPVALQGTTGEQPIEITSTASWSDRVFALRDIQSVYETAHLSGSLLYGGDRGLDLTLALAGERFNLGDRHVGMFDVTVNVDRAPEEDMSIMASGQVQDVWLSPSLRFDSVDGQIRNAPEGYNFAIQVKREHETRPTSLSVLGEADFGAEYPSGQIELDGSLLGEQVRSVQPVSWRLGETPSIEANLAIFGGMIEARIAEQTRTPRMTLTVRNVDLAPVLASAGIATRRVMVNGDGDFLLFGANPEGQFDMNVEGPLPGLERSLAVDLAGRLRNGALMIDGAGDYGELRLAGSATLPVVAEPEGIAHLDMERPVQGTVNLQGDLADLRSLALAYGHDIGGVIDASADLTGSLNDPAFRADANLTDGNYEFGTTSLKLVNLNLNADYENKALTLNGTSEGSDGGTAKVSGTLSTDDTDLTTEFADLLVYNRDGDSLRVNGSVNLAGSTDTRTVSGTVDVQTARFNLDNLPSSKAQAIDVRWIEDGVEGNGQSALRQSLALDVQISADRRVFVDGRGLESEWGADIKLTGTAAEPLLNGRATMRRGTLALAGRPFVFDRGTIYFDGPLQRARLDVEAERTVNGFEATVALAGSPTSPSIALSSSPDLPEDEILARLLFGRSSVDLSALEAAQLANSIARLSGNSSGFDPTSELQAALGVDRLSFGTNDEGSAQVGVGQYIADDVYLELNSAGAAGSSVEVEWEPRPQVSVTSETTTDGEAKLSIKWKKDY